MGEERGRRALGRMGVAALGLLAAGVFYLWPSLTALSTAPARPATPIEPTLGSVSFGDAQHGVVQVLGTSPGNYRTYITEDGGQTWKPPVSESKSLLARAVFLDRQTLLVQEIRPNARPGFRTTQDGGRTWRTLNDPRSADTAAGRVLPVGPGPTFMDAQNGWWVEHSPPDRGPPAVVGLWRTSDGGVTWQRLRAAGMPRTGYLMDPVFVDPMHGALSLATRPARSILTTSDGGDTWRVIEVPDPALMGTEVAQTIVLKHGRRLLAVLLAFPTRAMTDRFIIGDPSMVDTSLFVSVTDDGGQTWSRPRAGPNVVWPFFGFTIPQLDDRGRLLLLDGRRLWISEDDGVTWTALVVQAPAGLSPYAVVAAVPGALYAAAIAPTATDTVGASYRRTLIRSTDGGAHWSAVSLPRLTQT